jgi:hypothetical protein
MSHQWRTGSQRDRAGRRVQFSSLCKQYRYLRSVVSSPIQEASRFNPTFSFSAILSCSLRGGSICLSPARRELLILTARLPLQERRRARPPSHEVWDARASKTMASAVHQRYELSIIARVANAQRLSRKANVYIQDGCTPIPEMALVIPAPRCTRAMPRPRPTRFVLGNE